jgi:hypothetical protein
MSADSLSLIRQDVTRTLSIYLIPGFVASWPFIQTLQEKFPFVGYYLRSNSEVLILLFLLVSYTVGLILEDIAGNIEYYYCDKLTVYSLAKKNLKLLNIQDKATRKKTLKNLLVSKRTDFDTCWKNFMTMQTAESSLAVGHRVLRNVVMRLKFELSMGLALVVFLCGLTFLNNYIDFHFHWYYIAGSLGLSGFLILYEGPNSAGVLHDLRLQILASKQPTADNSGPSASR